MLLGDWMTWLPPVALSWCGDVFGLGFGIGGMMVAAVRKPKRKAGSGKRRAAAVALPERPGFAVEVGQNGTEAESGWNASLRLPARDVPVPQAQGGNREVLTVAEAAGWLRLHYKTVLELLANGRLRGVRVERKWLVPRDALREFVSGGVQG